MSHVNFDPFGSYPYCVVNEKGCGDRGFEVRTPIVTIKYLFIPYFFVDRIAGSLGGVGQFILLVRVPLREHGVCVVGLQSARTTRCFQSSWWSKEEVVRGFLCFTCFAI